MREKVKHFVKTYIRPVSLSECAKDPWAMRTAKTLVAYYYYLLPFLAMLFMTSSFSQRENFDPIWPLWWTEALSLELVPTIVAVKLFFVAAGVIVAFLHPYRIARILAFLAIWQVHALESSFGFMNHQWYLWLYTSLILIFLPNIWHSAAPSFDKKRKFLLQIWFAQALVMLTYTMAGIHKFMAVYIQYMAGEIHGFSLEAFAYQSADWVRQLQTPAIFAPAIIDHPEWWWFPYVLLYFLQLFALWTMVRTSLQKFWALAFTVFHFGTFVSMGIFFREQALLIIILFFNSPFAVYHITFKKFFFDLPVIGQIAEFVQKKRGRVV